MRADDVVHDHHADSTAPVARWGDIVTEFMVLAWPPLSSGRCCSPSMGDDLAAISLAIVFRHLVIAPLRGLLFR